MRSNTKTVFFLTIVTGVMFFLLPVSPVASTSLTNDYSTVVFGVS